jgi:hypothetical protein
MIAYEKTSEWEVPDLPRQSQCGDTLSGYWQDARRQKLPMAFLGLGKKDHDGRQVRIEHRGQHLRASRTGGIALREQISAGGLSLTVNTRHGARVSTTPLRNTQVAFQNSRFVLRGRYGKGPVKANLSKSGLSFSARAGLGTINLSHPGRSSAKLGGIQVRGQKAAAINAVVMLFQMLFVLLRAAVALVALLVVGLVNLISWSIRGSRALIDRWRFERDQRRRAARTEALQAAAGQWMTSNEGLMDNLGVSQCLAALELLLIRAGASQAGPNAAGEPTGTNDGSPAEQIRALIRPLWMIDSPEPIRDDRQSIELPVIGMAVLAIHLRRSASNDELLQSFSRLDDAALVDGPRTIGQELLLEDIADLFGLRLEARENSAPS